MHSNEQLFGGSQAEAGPSGRARMRYLGKSEPSLTVELLPGVVVEDGR
ncbi:MAG: hypothetical protein ABI596_00760 [Pyrinomonadaceae bacterium]